AGPSGNRGRPQRRSTRGDHADPTGTRRGSRTGTGSRNSPTTPALTMSSVGLIYVGAVLVINGLLLLGWLNAREAGPLNIFVGALQVVTPTYLIIAADGTTEAIFAASGIYLFGFTYLWVGINCLKDYSNRGCVCVALLVSLVTVVCSAVSFARTVVAGFGVVCALWGVMWFLFFVVLVLDLERVGPVVGVFTVVPGLNATVAAFLTD